MNVGLEFGGTGRSISSTPIATVGGHTSDPQPGFDDVLFCKSREDGTDSWWGEGWKGW